MTLKRIETEQQLYRLAEREEGVEVIVNLNGPVFSRHFFKAVDDEDWMFHRSYVDSSEQEGAKEDILSNTICKEAIAKGALYFE
mgnify:CR=1 FL=1